MTSLLIYGCWMLCILPTSPSETTVKIINTSSRHMVAGYVWLHQHFCYDSMNFDDMYFTTHFALDALTKITEQTAISDVFLMSHSEIHSDLSCQRKLYLLCWLASSAISTQKQQKQGQADDITSNKWVNCSNVTKLLHHWGTLQRSLRTCVIAFLIYP